MPRDNIKDILTFDDEIVPKNNKLLDLDEEFSTSDNENEIVEISHRKIPKFDSNEFISVIKNEIEQELNNQEEVNAQISSKENHNNSQKNVTNETQESSRVQIQEKQNTRRTDRIEPESLIDWKNGKIVPTGEDYKKVKFDPSQFDSRKNNKIPIIITRSLIILVFLILITLGLKNIIFPKQDIDENLVAQIVNKTTNQTGFNLDEGAHIAEQFVYQGLSLSNYTQSNNENQKNPIDFFFKDPLNPSSNLIIPDGFKAKDDKSNYDLQTIGKTVFIAAPRVVKQISYTPTSGDYYVTTIIQLEDQQKGKTNKQLTFHMSVYYNQKDKTYSIVPNSFSLVPNIELQDANKIPKALKIGSEEEPNKELKPILKPLVQSFLIEFAKSSDEHHDSIKQYLVENPDPSLYRGYAGEFKLANENPDLAIEYNVYNTSDANVFKILVSSKWTNSYFSFTSNNILTIRKTADGKYLVEKYAPYVYLEDKENK